MPDDEVVSPDYRGPDRRTSAVLTEVLTEVRQYQERMDDVTERLDAVAIAQRAEKQQRWIAVIGVLAIVVPLGGLQWFAIRQHDEGRKSEGSQNIACLLDQLFEHRSANDHAHREAAKEAGRPYVETAPPEVPAVLRGACDALLKKLVKEQKEEGK